MTVLIQLAYMHEQAVRSGGNKPLSSGYCLSLRSNKKVQMSKLGMSMSS